MQHISDLKSKCLHSRPMRVTQRGLFQEFSFGQSPKGGNTGAW